MLTKRPQRMADFMLGRADGAGGPGWLERRGLDAVPDWIWLGTTIESGEYVWRADHLRRIPVLVRFLSCEPLLGPLTDLDLDGISWVIVGGESGNGSRNFRPFEADWGHELLAMSREAGAAYYFKQDAGVRTELRPDLLGRRYEEYPLPHPALGAERTLGVYTDDTETPVAVKAGQGSLL